MVEKNQPSAIRHYRNLTKTIVQQYFGKPASRLVYKSSGLTNYVFAINHVEGQFVVRISPDLERIKAFQKERWASQKAREAGVPTPEVLAVGNDAVSEPYMIMRRVTGTEASHHPNRVRIVHAMAEYGSIINSIPTMGFGRNFDWTNDTNKNTTWASYLENEFDLDARVRLFATNNILTDAQSQELVRMITNAGARQVTTCLNHSDLRLKNVIVDEGGDIAAIVDWENCISTIAPEWELSIALHDLTIDEKHAFIDGYGLSAQQVEEMAPLIKAFNILNYSQELERAVDTEDEKSLAEIKLRLSGSFDLYSL